MRPVNDARKVLNSYDGTREHMRRILETTLLVSPLRRDEAYLEQAASAVADARIMGMHGGRAFSPARA